jgi:hypothetical protein
LPQAIISDVSANPDPTNGADTIWIKATAKVFEPDLEDNYIAAAYLTYIDDTMTFPMQAADGRFSDTLEIVEGHLDVSCLEPGTTWVYVNVVTSMQDRVSQCIQIEITESNPAE